MANSMNTLISKSVALGLLALGASSLAQAHEASAVLDYNGDTPSFTALARATCFDDGAGKPVSLIARIRDDSPPVNGLYLSLQIIKGTQAVSTTDIISGDGQYSNFAGLNGGAGTYTLVLTHTRAGARAFKLEYHCMTANDLHTGTDILLDQFQ